MLNKKGRLSATSAEIVSEILTQFLMP